MRIDVDRGKCEGLGMCEAMASDYFERYLATGDTQALSMSKAAPTIRPALTVRVVDMVSSLSVPRSAQFSRGERRLSLFLNRPTPARFAWIYVHQRFSDYELPMLNGCARLDLASPLQ